MIPSGKQDINQGDIDAVVNVLKSDFLTQGQQVPLFEKILADYCGVNYAIAVNSATSALHIACLALGLKKGDYLWTSTNTFVASANCALYCGAKVDFVDIDTQTYNLSADLLEEKLIKAKKDGKLPKIIIPVHFAGQSCDMVQIHRLSQKYGFKIIEDASHAIGAKYLEKPIGSCQYSDITIFSFHPVKIITTAEGGMATTNNKELAHKMQLLRSHGVTKEDVLMHKASEGDWYYQQIDLGFNYRMTELQAALGVSQMQRLDDFVQKRQKLAQRYNELLLDLAIILPYQNQDTYSSYHLYPVLLKNNNRKQIFEALRKKDIGVHVHYIPVHTQPYYQKLGFKQDDFPNAQNYYNQAISLPLFHLMTHKEQDYIVDMLYKIIH